MNEKQGFQDSSSGGAQAEAGCDWSDRRSPPFAGRAQLLGTRLHKVSPVQSGNRGLMRLVRLLRRYQPFIAMQLHYSYNRGGSHHVFRWLTNQLIISLGCWLSSPSGASPSRNSLLLLVNDIPNPPAKSPVRNPWCGESLHGCFSK